jgi:hypothetical protein
MTRPAPLPEHTEAVLLMRAVHGATRTWPELAMFHAIPNGGHRSKRTAADLKAEGVRPGVPDYCLPVPRGKFHGLYVELKRTAGGRPSPEQRQWLAALEQQGYLTHVARGWQDAWAVIRDYLASDGPEGT